METRYGEGGRPGLRRAIRRAPRERKSRPGCPPGTADARYRGTHLARSESMVLTYPSTGRLGGVSLSVIRKYYFTIRNRGRARRSPRAEGLDGAGGADGVAGGGGDAGDAVQVLPGG